MHPNKANQEQKIREGNHEVAIFMGATIDEDLNVMFILPADGIGLAGCGLHACKYHSSWDWLMPVCLKFDKICEGNPLFKRAKKRWQKYEKLCDDIDNAVTLYDIIPVFEAVVKAATWYSSIATKTTKP